MQNLAKKKTTFSRNIPFISTCFIVNTNKCKILQKRKRLFREIFHLLVHVSLLLLVNAKSCKKENDFFARYSIDGNFSAELCDEFRGVPWSSCTILQKAKRHFYKIFHLLVYPLLLLVNAESWKKENDFFARYSIY